MQVCVCTDLDGVHNILYQEVLSNFVDGDNKPGKVFKLWSFGVSTVVFDSQQVFHVFSCFFGGNQDMPFITTALPMLDSKQSYIPQNTITTVTN